MTSLNPAELNQLAIDLAEQLKGAQLQDAFLGPKGPALQFWKQGLWTLYFDLTPVAPLVFLFEGKGPIRKQKATKPALLFLRSHGVNKLFDGAWVDSDKGRVLDLSLKSENSHLFIEIRLFPHGQNFSIEFEGKKVHWSKPKDLVSSERDLGEFQVERRLSELAEKFQSKLRPQEKKDSKEKALLSQLKKTKKALGKIELELSKRESQQWKKAGEALLEGQSLQINEELLEYVNPNQSLAWNIENCFNKEKDNRKKIGHLRDRRSEAEQEVLKLEAGDTSQLQGPKAKSIASELMQKSGARGRKLSLSQGVEAIIGRSAKDNIALLRRAQAWDLWLHLRDFPGAHAIIRRNKKTQVSEAEYRQVSQWLVRESLGNRVSSGEVYKIIVAECRYVRPIKGDKLGRVTYQNESNYQFKI